MAGAANRRASGEKCTWNTTLLPRLPVVIRSAVVILAVVPLGRVATTVDAAVAWHRSDAWSSSVR